ncbi:helix-turn-helix domain-containing protein [Danxiaibacter flavus]|uniref:Helix-turn-helix domain-containing protein n=1 Tax=Danxiaibacter flavus TaxID=3049108 RepID=A0ABV3ZLU1_9BACT|nr:helix-turn-helix domain-containing protein [Chitinophagaceae bacterium DXS]
MKPVFAKIPEDLKEVFAVRVTNLPYFSTEFHFHHECQLVYVVESEGKRIIGDSVETFTNDEVILLGSDIPHVWCNDSKYFDKDQQEKSAHSIAIFFDPEKLIELLSHFGSVKKLESLLKNAGRGISFQGKTKEKIKELITTLKEQENLSRLITLLKIFEVAIQTDEYHLLASSGYVNTYHAKDNDRMDKVFKYVFNNFTRDIQLEHIAELANMNKQSFCRYFKSRTQKTFIEFLNEIRIAHACKLIAEGENHIAGIAYNCGYNSLSNFNRFFKEIKGISPKAYSKQISLSAPGE